MGDPLQRIAALLPTLSHAETRVLIVLTAKPQITGTRAIAAAAGLARSNTVTALHALTARGMIAGDAGSSTRPARIITLDYLETAQIPEPLEPQVPLLPGPKSGPPLVL